MQHEIFDNGQLNVEITNVKASDEEIEKLKACIAKGTRYTVKFSVRGPTYFDLSNVQEWLYSVGLVGWQIEAKSGPKE